jgi:ABC transporter substrate binding protein
LRNRDLIIGLAARHRIPAVYPERNYVLAGGLMSYGIADLVEPFRQAASYVNRILRGAQPAELPVQAPTRYATTLNMRAVNALGFGCVAGLGAGATGKIAARRRVGVRLAAASSVARNVASSEATRPTARNTSCGSSARCRQNNRATTHPCARASAVPPDCAAAGTREKHGDCKGA